MDRRAKQRSRGKLKLHRGQTDQESQTCGAEPATFCGMDVKGNSEGRGYLLQISVLKLGCVNLVLKFRFLN